ncbi:hypothetical protein FoTM2_013214, partial [Fusarium oxysporum f. sp. vasinfectum]
MDATAEILVQGGDSVATTRRSSRTTKPTAKLQEKLQAAEKKTDMAKNMWSQQSHEGGSEGENGPADRVGESQMMGDATGNDASLMQTMLRGMLQETSTHLMSEQKQMLEPLGRVDGEPANGDADMSEQLETIRQLHKKYGTGLNELRKFCFNSGITSVSFSENFALGFGIQNYSCVGAGAAPAVIGASAVLYDVTNLYHWHG